MIKLALVSAWPTKLDAITLYCWNQKNYNTNYNHSQRLKGCSQVKKLTQRNQTQIQSQVFMY